MQYSVEQLRTGGKNYFEEVILKAYESLFTDSKKSSEPNFFGKNLHPAVEFSHFKVVEIKNIKLNQTHRVNTHNPEHDNISKSIQAGWKIKYVPPCILEQPGQKTDIITGNTRIAVFIDNNIEYMVVAVYKPKASLKNALEIKEAVIEMGQKFQHTDPASAPSQADISSSVSKLIDLYKVSEGKLGVPEHLAAILEKVRDLSGNTFKESKIQQIANSIYNTHNPANQIAGWSTSRGAEFHPIRAATDDYKLIDNNNVKYLVTCASQAKYVYLKSKEWALANKNKDIRIVLWPSPLASQSSYDLLESYNTQIKKWYSEFNLYKAVDLGLGMPDEVFKQIVFYGSLPTVQPTHAMDNIVLFNEKQGRMFQKNREYSFSLYDDNLYDDNLYDEAA